MAVVDTQKSCTGNDIVTVRVVSLGFSGGDTLSYVQDWCFVFTATSLHYRRMQGKTFIFIEKASMFYFTVPLF